MIVYVLAHDGLCRGLSVFTLDSVERAKAFAETLREPAANVVEREEDLTLDTTSLVRLYNTLANAPDDTDAGHVKRFATRKDGQRRVFQELENAYKNQPLETAAIAPDAPAGAETTSEEDDVKTVKKTKKAKVAKAPKAAKTPRVAKAPKEKKVPTGKPAGKVAEFGQVRDGTTRANILREMNGRQTIADIADTLKIPASLVSSNIFCLWRDIAVGYAYDEKRRVTALYPTGKTLKDAIKKVAV